MSEQVQLAGVCWGHNRYSSLVPCGFGMLDRVVSTSTEHRSNQDCQSNDIVDSVLMRWRTAMVVIMMKMP